MKAKIQSFFNEKQIEFVQARQKVRALIAGRGFGKSTLIAWLICEMLRVLVVRDSKGKIIGAGKIFFASTTVEQIKNSMLPPIRDKWAEFGLKEDVHYVIGKRPPDWYKKPFSPPEKFDNCITFWNGFTIMLLSTAKPTGKRGGSYDAGIVDEAAFVKGSVFRSVFMPMIRGNLYRFQTHWHHALIVLSSRPRKTEGFWVYDLKKEAEKDPSKVLWMEASAFANRAVLGEDWFDDQRRTLGEEEYSIEIENKEQRQLPNGFYHTLDRRRNTYSLLPGNTDVRASELLEVSFDFGGKFTCASVWQEQDFVEKCLRQFFIKKGQVTTLVDSICGHYKNHAYKYVRIWGEPRGQDPDPERPALYTIIQAAFERHGWMVEVKVQAGYKTKGHKERYEFMSIAHQGNNPLLPAIQYNAAAAPDLLIALENCDIKDDFQKDKSNEKDPNFPQEHAPHFTDGVDYYLFEKHGWRLADGSNHRPGGAWS